MTDSSAPRAFAVVTGASTGIGFELARCCIADGYDVLMSADETSIHDAAKELRTNEAHVQSVEADLATEGGVEKLYAATNGREVDALLANAGRGLGHGFLDQDWTEVRRVIDTNITGTVLLIQKIGADMRRRGSGRILITGSIAGFMPGTFQAVYNGSKAFLNSFSFAIREELRDTGVSVTCLMPGSTETKFFERAHMLDTSVGTAKKDDAADVARAGFEAMKRGGGDIVTGLSNKIQSAVANVTPAPLLAKRHRKMAEPGTGR